MPYFAEAFFLFLCRSPCPNLWWGLEKPLLDHGKGLAVGKRCLPGGDMGLSGTRVPCQSAIFNVEWAGMFCSTRTCSVARSFGTVKESCNDVSRRRAVLISTFNWDGFKQPQRHLQECFKSKDLYTSPPPPFPISFPLVRSRKKECPFICWTFFFFLVSDGVANCLRDCQDIL